MKSQKIYVATSWRNKHQQQVVETLRALDYEVYDFRNPKPGDDGFAWSEIEPDWLQWDAKRFRQALKHPIANRGFEHDWDTMEWADTCVMVLPCGRSAHIEAGYFVGAGKKLIIFMQDDNEPELMYKITPHICTKMSEVVYALEGVNQQSDVPVTINPKEDAFNEEWLLRHAARKGRNRSWPVQSQQRRMIK